MRTEWTARTVTDVVGTAGSVVLDDESTTTTRGSMPTTRHGSWGSGITYEDNETLISGFGIRVEYDSEWSAERSAEAIYEYMRERGEPVTMSR